MKSFMDTRNNNLQVGDDGAGEGEVCLEDATMANVEEDVDMLQEGDVEVLQASTLVQDTLMSLHVNDLLEEQ